MRLVTMAFTCLIGFAAIASIAGAHRQQPSRRRAPRERRRGFTDEKTWQALSVAQPTTVKAHNQFFNGVSCSSTTSCVGVGESANTADHAGAFAEVLSDGAFRVSKISWPANSQNSLNAVSCPTATYCLAVGGLGGFQTLACGKAAFVDLQRHDLDLGAALRAVP